MLGNGGGGERGWHLCNGAGPWQMARERSELVAGAFSASLGQPACTLSSPGDKPDRPRAPLLHFPS